MVRLRPNRNGRPCLGVALHQVQSHFRYDPALYRAFVGGRGAGKSCIGAYDLLCRLRAGRTYLIGSPTSILMQDTTFPTTKYIAESLGIWLGVKLTPYPTAQIVTHDRGVAEVRFRTAEDPEKMRGPNLSGVWLDEASLMHEDAYKINIAALRENNEQGWLSATFTPKGPTHWTFETFASGKPNTSIFKSRTGDNPFLPLGFEDTLKHQYGETAFARQELGGEFVSIAGAEFPGEWFDWPGFWFENWPDNLVYKVIYLDPSKGVSDFPGDAKKNLEGDYQAYVLAGLDDRGTIYLDAQLNRENPVAMIERGVRLCHDWGPVSDFSFEDNGTMGFMVPEVQRQINAAGMLVPWNAVVNTMPKIHRIRHLASYLSRRQIRIRSTPGGKKPRAQLGDVPFGFYDDGPDAAAGAIRRLELLTVGA
jgi:phage terminase large subunit-like protein